MNDDATRDGIKVNHPRMNLTHSLLIAALAIFVVVATPLAAPAGSHGSATSQCKQIRAAVSANRTLEQITAESDTDAAHVMKCMESQGKSRKPPKESKSSGGKTAKRHK